MMIEASSNRGLQIAAVAHANELAVVTNNPRDFQGIESYVAVIDGRPR